MTKLSCLFFGHAWIARIWKTHITITCQHCDKIDTADFADNNYRFARQDLKRTLSFMDDKSVVFTMEGDIVMSRSHWQRIQHSAQSALGYLGGK